MHTHAPTHMHTYTEHLQLGPLLLLLLLLLLPPLLLLRCASNTFYCLCAESCAPKQDVVREWMVRPPMMMIMVR